MQRLRRSVGEGKILTEQGDSGSKNLVDCCGMGRKGETRAHVRSNYLCKRHAGEVKVVFPAISMRVSYNSPLISYTKQVEYSTSVAFDW